MKLLEKISIGALLTVSMITPSLANQDVKAVDQLDLNKYLGTWHEVARKPLTFQKDCAYNVTANYSLNDKGNVKVDNRCYKADGVMKQSTAEAYVQNAPANSKLKVSFLPKAIRWIPIARGDYWVLKIDQNYQTALVGEPDKKYLWVLSRDPQPNKAVVQEYLNYAQSIGYDLSDVIYTPYKAK
jgi:apolipoprotein D and lipocalin family protein